MSKGWHSPAAATYGSFVQFAEPALRYSRKTCIREDLHCIAEARFMTKLVPSRSCFRDLSRMDVRRHCVPLFIGVGRPMRLL